MSFRWNIEKKVSGSRVRAGEVQTANGNILTPAFVVVGTKATVKAVTPEQLEALRVPVVLANTYHLYLEPGEKVIKEAGGLGKFMGWQGPTMTDSGGFQVFSLGSDFDKKVGKIGGKRNTATGGNKEMPTNISLAKIDDEGVSFKSPKDGSIHRFTPERSIEIQRDIGADIIFAFDECTSPTVSYDYQKEAMIRTHSWATRSLQKHKELQSDSALFGIVQGGRFEDLRKESAKTIGKMEFDGFGIGGSFDKEDIATAVAWVNDILPEEKPRHLLGIGDPRDLLPAIEAGCDLFDCVAPTRNARNATLYTKNGSINITNAKFVHDFSPIDEGCDCYSCLPWNGGAGFTRAYLAHLFRSGELLANTLASIHNLRFVVRLMEQSRSAILEERFKEFKDEFLIKYSKV